MTGGSRRSLLRVAPRAGLVPVAAFAVHQLRYLLAYGSGAGAELRETGHSYLHSVVPWIVLLVGLSAGTFLWALGRTACGRRCAGSRRTSFLVLWLACATCLIAIYCTQELLEGLFATGHPTGIAGIFGFGGLWAIPSAVAVGLALATIFCGARWTLEQLGHRHRSVIEMAVRRIPLAPCPHQAVRSAVEPLVRGWCDRGPPAPRPASA